MWSRIVIGIGGIIVILPNNGKCAHSCYSKLYYLCCSHRKTKAIKRIKWKSTHFSQTKENRVRKRNKMPKIGTLKLLQLTLFFHPIRASFVLVLSDADFSIVIFFLFVCCLKWWRRILTANIKCNAECLFRWPKRLKHILPQISAVIKAFNGNDDSFNLIFALNLNKWLGWFLCQIQKIKLKNQTEKNVQTLLYGINVARHKKWVPSETKGNAATRFHLKYSNLTL